MLMIPLTHLKSLPWLSKPKQGHMPRTDLLRLLRRVIVHARHAEGVLVKPLHPRPIGARQPVRAVWQRQLRLGARRLPRSLQRYTWVLSRPAHAVLIQLRARFSATACQVLSNSASWFDQQQTRFHGVRVARIEEMQRAARVKQVSWRRLPV